MYNILDNAQSTIKGYDLITLDNAPRRDYREDHTKAESLVIWNTVTQ